MDSDKQSTSHDLRNIYCSLDVAIVVVVVTHAYIEGISKVYIAN